MKFEILTAVIITIAVFCDAMACSFESFMLKIKEVLSSKMMAPLYNYVVLH
jgi:hypothetical protein